MSTPVPTPMAKDERGQSIPAFFPGTTQAMSVTSTSQQSSSLGSDTGLVRIYSSVEARVEFGSSPTASDSSMIVGPGESYFAVRPNQKVAIKRTGSDDGIASITMGALVT